MKVTELYVIFSAFNCFGTGPARIHNNSETLENKHGNTVIRSPLGQSIPGCFTQVAAYTEFSLIFVIRKL